MIWLLKPRQNRVPLLNSGKVLCTTKKSCLPLVQQDLPLGQAQKNLHLQVAGFATTWTSRTGSVHSWSHSYEVQAPSIGLADGNLLLMDSWRDVLLWNVDPAQCQRMPLLMWQLALRRWLCQLREARRSSPRSEAHYLCMMPHPCHFPYESYLCTTSCCSP
jgi:hypothetical protein